MPLTATICALCRLAPAVYLVSRPGTVGTEACPVCAARERKNHRDASLSILTAEDGDVTVKVEQADLYGGPPKVDELTYAIRHDPAVPLPGLGDNAGVDAALPRSGTRRRLVLDAIRAAGPDGATDDELCEATGMDYSNLGPRRRELLAAGWVRDSGRKRPSRSGVQVAVYVAREV